MDHGIVIAAIVNLSNVLRKCDISCLQAPDIPCVGRMNFKGGGTLESGGELDRELTARRAREERQRSQLTQARRNLIRTGYDTPDPWLTVDPVSRTFVEGDSSGYWLVVHWANAREMDEVYRHIDARILIEQDRMRIADAKLIADAESNQADTQESPPVDVESDEGDAECETPLVGSKPARDPLPSGAGDYLVERTLKMLHGYKVHDSLSSASVTDESPITIRAIEKESGVSRSTVQRWFEDKWPDNKGNLGYRSDCRHGRLAMQLTRVGADISTLASVDPEVLDKINEASQDRGRRSELEADDD